MVVSGGLVAREARESPEEEDDRGKERSSSPPVSWSIAGTPKREGKGCCEVAQTGGRCCRGTRRNKSCVGGEARPEKKRMAAFRVAGFVKTKEEAGYGILNPDSSWRDLK